MPSDLEVAMNSIHFSRLEKAYVHFPQAFWDINSSDGYGQPGKFATENLWASPRYAPDTNPYGFNMESFGFSSMPNEFAHPTLCFFLYGDFSRQVTEAVQQLDISSSAYCDVLEKFLKPYYSLFPNYNDGAPECTPTGFLVTDWEHDHLAGNGSYTTFQVGLKDGGGCIERLREGMAERHVWLAGEHTAPFRALGTILGAYWSGERVGQKTGALYGLCDDTAFGVLFEDGNVEPKDITDLLKPEEHATR